MKLSNGGLTSAREQSGTQGGETWREKMI